MSDHSAETAAAAKPKDFWDKIDIVARAAIPAIVAFSVWLWNAERTARDTAAQMITIATTILAAPPDKPAPSALRDWAIDVLQSPENPPTLDDEAAQALRMEGLPFILDGAALGKWSKSPRPSDDPSSQTAP